jgi:predicted nuclease of restriction endonuclease-like (RecB) superfamily
MVDGMKGKAAAKSGPPVPSNYGHLVNGIASVIDAGRQQAAWSLNAIMSAVYWDIGRQIVLFEQGGKARAEHGTRLVNLLAKDLTARFGRGFRQSNLYHIRAFYLAYAGRFQTVSGILPASGQGSERFQTVSGKLDKPKGGRYPAVQVGLKSEQLAALTRAFPLPWSHYSRLLTVDNPHARDFYETEAMRGGWSWRQLDRQISSQFYERTALSRNKAAMLRKGAKPDPDEMISPETELKDPYILEFLRLKDEYSEGDLEEALALHLEQFLRELGNDFAFVGRQHRLRIGHEWYRVDLLFFHRRLQCLVVIDLKVGKFTHADAGQMHMYLNYAREHWTNPHENPPVGLILCAEKDAAVAKYALEGLPNKVLAAEYKLVLPNEKMLVAELKRTRRILDARRR